MVDPITRRREVARLWMTPHEEATHDAPGVSKERIKEILDAVQVRSRETYSQLRKEGKLELKKEDE